MYYTVIKNGDGKEFIDEQYEGDHIDFIKRNYDIGIKPREIKVGRGKWSLR